MSSIKLCQPSVGEALHYNNDEHNDDSHGREYVGVLDRFTTRILETSSPLPSQGIYLIKLSLAKGSGVHCKVLSIKFLENNLNGYLTHS